MLTNLAFAVHYSLVQSYKNYKYIYIYNIYYYIYNI